MAKRHIKQYIKCLGFEYSEAQKLYEKCAEALSDTMIDPETYEKFCLHKNKLDQTLRIWSSILDTALDRKKFLKEFSKVQARLKASKDLLKALELDPTATDEYQLAVCKNTANLEAELFIFRKVEIISSIKNRKTERNRGFIAHIGELDYDISALEQFYKTNLISGDTYE